MVKILPVTYEDLESINELTPDGWGDVGPAFRYYLDVSFCDPLKAEINGKLVGVGTLIYNEDTVWLAAIIVNKEYRNRGIGTAITQALVDKVDRSHYKTIMLDATEYGQPVYEKLGFLALTGYLHFQGTQSNATDTDTCILPFEEKYRADILEMDRIASGEDRRRTLLMHVDNALLYVRDNKLLGVHFPSLSRGPITAVDADAGIALMKHRIKTREQCMVPEHNKAAIDFLLANGFTYERTSRRMRLGIGRQWTPMHIYNTISGALG